MITFTKEELEQLGFKHSWNIRKPHEWFIVTDTIRIRYFHIVWSIDYTLTIYWLCEVTELWLMPSIRSYIPKTMEDIINIIKIIK